MASKNLVKSELNQLEQTEDESVGDPFAIDFFSQPKTAVEEDEFDEVIAENDSHEQDLAIVAAKRAWNVDLPQVSASEVGQALIFSDLPDNLPKIICEIYVNTITQIVLQGSAEVSCEVINTLETNFLSEITALSQAQAVCLSFVVEPQQTAAMLIMDSVFAVNVIEKAFSGEASAIERRELSKTELSVLEFLSLNCLKEINDYFSEPLLRWLSAEQSETSLVLGRGLLSQIRIKIGDSKGVVKLLLPFDFLENLSKSKNPLLARRNNRNKKLAQITQIISGNYLRAAIGNTIVNAEDLAVLESGDIILIERPEVQFADSEITGSIQIRIADELEPSLSGELTAGEKTPFLIKEINQKSENKLTKFMLPENQIQTLPQSDAEDAESGLALDKIVVNVAVELVSRRLSLNEIANLRVGQIIELGSRATDPVELVVSGKTVAIGELIDVEGSLGVRLTRVLL